MEILLFNLKAPLHLRNKAGPSRDAQQNRKLIWTDLTFKYSVLPQSTVCRLNTELYISLYFIGTENNAVPTNTISKQLKCIIINSYQFLKGSHWNFNPISTTMFLRPSNTPVCSGGQEQTYCTLCEGIKPFPTTPLNQDSVWGIKHN